MVGVFDVAVTGEDEQRIAKQVEADRLAAAIYDVREKHGAWLFGASDLDAFNDRAKLSYVSICKTIEPHLHARMGIHRRVMASLEKEWRQRQACYPGCDENEAHAKKFHKDKGDNEGSDKEARRRQAGEHDSPFESDDSRSHAVPELINSQPGSPNGTTYMDREPGSPTGPSKHRTVEEDPQHAHDVIDHAHGLADEKAQHAHDVLDHSHDLVDQRAPQGPHRHEDMWSPDEISQLKQQSGGPDQYGNGEPMNTHSPGYDPNLDTGWQDGGQGGQQDPYAGDPINDIMDSPLGQNFQDQGSSFGRPVDEAQHWARRMFAEFEDQPDHPEQHIQKTFQDHQGEELIPEGNFDAYKNRVDQGGPSKVESHDFIPGAHTDRHDESDSDNFIPTVTGSREYDRIARMVFADDLGGGMGAAPTLPDTNPGGGMNAGVDASAGAAPAGPSAAPAGLPAAAPAPAAGAAPAAPAAAPIMASREYQTILAMTADAPGIRWANKAIVQSGALGARKRLLAAAHSQGVLHDSEYRTLMGKLRRTADRNYLQQADESITKVLNEKAEEFQNTIAPLQQALITIQQAEALQNPLNVQSPAGTVNVLPQGSAGAQAPQGQGGLGADPAAAGLAAGGDPAAAGAAPPAPAPDPTQVQARRRRRPLGSAPKRADVSQNWDSFQHQSPNLGTGSEADYDQFAEKKHYTPGGPAIKKLRQQQGTDFNGVGPSGTGAGAAGKGLTAAVEPGYVWSKAPSSVTEEWSRRAASGGAPDDVYRAMIAEITDHHTAGHIGNDDAHRAAKEAFGRFLLARKRLAKADPGRRRPLARGDR